MFGKQRCGSGKRQERARSAPSAATGSMVDMVSMVWGQSKEMTVFFRGNPASACDHARNRRTGCRASGWRQHGRKRPPCRRSGSPRPKATTHGGSQAAESEQGGADGRVLNPSPRGFSGKSPMAGSLTNGNRLRQPLGFVGKSVVTSVVTFSQRIRKYSIIKMGRPTGLEPATPRFTILCSNQLSYDRRKLKNIHARVLPPSCQSLLPHG